MAGRSKNIPKNSFSIIIKFETTEARSGLMEDAKFQEIKGQLEVIAPQKGGSYQSFIH